MSAFANSRGGWIILGVRESGRSVIYEGVDNADAKLTQIHDLLRNPEKVSRPVCGEGDVRVVHAGEYRHPHRIGFRVVTSPEGRWDDRLLWDGNLVDGYFEGFRRLAADLPVRFRLHGDVRATETPAHTALREALVNALVHADYAERDATLVVRSPQGFMFRNPGSSRLATADLHAGDRSDPRNPTRVKAFREIGLAEEAGTGIGSIRRAWRELGYAEPELDTGTASDRYEFRLELPYVYLISDEDRLWLAALGEAVTEAEALALVQARHAGYVDNQSLRRVTGQHPADTTRVLSGLGTRELLRLQGVGRGAYYELGPAALAGTHSARVASRSVAGPAELRQLWTELLTIAEPVRSRPRVLPSLRDDVLVRLCRVLPLSLPELAELLGRKETVLREPIRALLKRGSLGYLFPENPSHAKQKYVAIHPEDGSGRRAR